MVLELEILQENGNNSKNIFGEFCDVGKILDPKFNEENEYKEILKELGIEKYFKGKSEKRIILLRHFEDDKNNGINEELTEKGLLNGKRKTQELAKYLGDRPTTIRYAGLGKNRETVNRTSQTAELLVNNLKNISGIVQEDGLDSTYKNDNKKTKNLVDQEVKTIDFLEDFKEQQNDNLSDNTEIWIVHKTNMDKILRDILGVLPENKAFYGALDFGETFEFDMGFNEKGKLDFLKQNSNLIKLTNSNYLEIIEELKNVENEKISKAIGYFKNGKIKIIDLQNVINKQILEDNEFIKNFKNSDNLDLRKLAFINILEGEDFFDEEVEDLILKCSLDLEIINLLKYFSDIFENYNYDLNYEAISAIYNDFEVKKDKLLKFVKVIGILNSTKILNLKYLSELNSFLNFLKEKDNEFNFETYEVIISGSVIEKGYSSVFKENLDNFVNFLGLDNPKKEYTFIIKTNIFNDGISKGISGDIKLFDLENNENIELSYEINGIIKNYIENEVESERYHLSFPYYIVFKFIGNRLVLEKGNIVYGNIELGHKDFIKLEELFQDGIFKGQITQDFKDFFYKNKNTQYFQRHLENIVGIEVQKIYMKLLELLRKENKDIDSYMISNQDSGDYILLFESLLENVSKYKELVDKSDLKKLKKEFYLKIDFYNKIILKYIYPDYQKSSFIKIQMIEMIKCINAYIKD